MSAFVVSAAGRARCRIEPGDTGYSAAADALKLYLTKITGVKTFDDPALPAIRFRKGPRGRSGFARFLEGNDLILEAETPRSAQYAVYDLLEALAGCRFFTPRAELVPKDPDLTLEVEPYAYEAPMGYREIYYRDFQDGDFCVKRKADQFGKHEGWGYWCHSFNNLIPAEKYFDEHPEYFAMIDGKRDPQGQPCLSNPEVLEVVCENLAAAIAENPEAVYWSVSQNDHDRYCRCPQCAAMDEAEGTPMGSMLDFVNKVARRFPEKQISTLAYWYTRKAPKHIRPEKNVHILLCNIEALRGEPLESDPRNAGSVQELKEWSAITDNILLWDYNIQFANLQSPFPNLDTLGPNMRFLARNSVSSLFSQCNREYAGDMYELRGYLLSKLAWDPTVDDRAVIEDFCRGYYGAAGEHILHYLDTMHAASHASGAPLGIFDGPESARESYLTEELMASYREDFDAAEAAVAEDDELLNRVRMARLSIIYAQLVLRYGSVEERRALTARFARDARVAGLQKVEEWHITVEQFVTDTLVALEREEAPSFSRECLPAMRLMGTYDYYADRRGTANQIFASFNHSLMQLKACMDASVIPLNYRFFSFEEGNERFMGAPMAPGVLTTPVDAGFLYRDIPALDCVAVRTTRALLDEAKARIPAYLAAHGLRQCGTLLDEESRTGLHTLFVPVEEDA